MDNCDNFRRYLFALYEVRFEFLVDNFYTIMQIFPQKSLKGISSFTIKIINYLLEMLMINEVMDSNYIDTKFDYFNSLDEYWFVYITISFLLNSNFF